MSHIAIFDKSRHGCKKPCALGCDPGNECPGELDSPESVFQAEPVTLSILATVREAFAGYPWRDLGVACTVGAACLSALLIAVNPGVFLS